MRRKPSIMQSIAALWFSLGQSNSSREHLEFMNHFGHGLGSGPSTPEMMTRALASLAAHVQVASCVVIRLSGTTAPSGAFRLVPYARFPIPSSLPVKPREPLYLDRAPHYAQVIDSAQTLIIRQDQADGRMGLNEAGLFQSEAFQSACLVPLIAESRVLGVLAVSEDRLWKTAPLGAERVALLELTANLIAAALYREELRESLKQQTTENRWLSDSIGATEPALDSAHVRQRVIEQTARALYVPWALYFTYDAQQSRATVTNEYQRELDASPRPNLTSGSQLELRTMPAVLQALLAGRPVVTRADDPKADPKLREILKSSSGACLLQLPLQVGGRLLGILALWETRLGREWTEDEIGLGQRMVAHAAVTLASSELIAREQRRARQFQLIADVSSQMAAVADVNVLARVAIEQVGANFDCANVTLFLKQPNLDHLTYWAADSKQLPHLVISEQPVQVGAQDWLARVLKNGETLVMTEADANPTDSANPAQERALVAISLKAGGQVLGVLQVRGRRADSFDPLDLSTLEMLAGQFAAALASTRAQAVMREHTQSLQALQRLSQEITTRLDVDEVCRAIYRGTRELMDCDAFFIALYDAEAQAYDFIFRMDNGALLPVTRITMNEGMTSYVLRSRRPVMVADVSLETRFNIQHWGGQQVRSVLCVPMQVGDRVVGALSVQSYRTAAYDLAELYLFSTLAGQAAVAINNAQLFTSSHRKMTQLSVLNEVGRIVSSTIEIDHLLELIYDQVRRVLSADTYYVALYNPEDASLTIEVLVDEGERYPRAHLPRGTGLASVVVQQHAPLLLRHVPDEEPRVTTQPTLLGNARPSLSWLGVPMITSEHLVGVLAVASYLDHAFDHSDQDILQNVATQAAIAIDNARHHAEVEEQARRDSLTQVFNHGYFLVRLRQEVQRALETGRPLSLVMLDIDYFKNYNDRFGHLAGDSILCGIVQAIRDNIKRTDMVGRWGGEEFVIALLDTDRGGGRTVAERIRKTLASMSLCDDTGRPVPVPTVSQGIATLPEDAIEAIAMVDLADQKLYIAKTRGRDQVEA